MGRVFPPLGGDHRKSIEFRHLKSISDGPDLIIAGLVTGDRQAARWWTRSARCFRRRKHNPVAPPTKLSDVNQRPLVGPFDRGDLRSLVISVLSLHHCALPTTGQTDGI
jgi:hypothetical protein